MYYSQNLIRNMETDAFVNKIIKKILNDKPTPCISYFKLLNSFSVFERSFGRN